MKLSTELIRKITEESSHWKPGDNVDFTYGNWQITITRENKLYEPFLFFLEGVNRRGGSFTRRYISIEKAILHVINHFNENVAVRNRFESLRQYYENENSSEY